MILLLSGSPIPCPSDFVVKKWRKNFLRNFGFYRRTVIRIYQLWMEFTIDGKQLGTQQQCVFPIAYTCAGELSDIVESGTVIGKRGTESIVYNEHITRGDMIITDFLF